jgi:hypothetical protein
LKPGLSVLVRRGWPGVTSLFKAEAFEPFELMQVPAPSITMLGRMGRHSNLFKISLEKVGKAPRTARGMRGVLLRVAAEVAVANAPSQLPR